ncbi:MAG: hypothetical protein IBX47_06635, partial [Desulfuromonadales bacterium]|nr:hypothetical protein [Desulfuromonadales bacterium]
DNSSGVNRTEYRVDGGDWLVYSDTIYLPESGEHLIEYLSRDQLDHAEGIKQISLTVDAAAPQTDISAGDPQYVGTDGKLFVSSQTALRLTALDRQSGVARTDYSVDDALWTEYLGPFTFAVSGEHQVTYRSVDYLGNVEIERQKIVTVDNIAPTTSVRFENSSIIDGDNIIVSRATTVVLDASDNMTAVLATYFSFDDHDWQAYVGPIQMQDLLSGYHILSYYSIDSLGNQEVVQTATLYVVEVSSDTAILHAPRVLVWADVDGHEKDDDNDHDHDRASDKKDDDDDKRPDEHQISREERLKRLLESALGGEALYSTVTADKEVFKTLFRSGIYTTIVVVDEQLPWGDDLRRELVEAVYRGTGLVFVGKGDLSHKEIADILGVHYRGSMPEGEDDRSLQLFDSPVSSATIQGYEGRVWRTDLAGGALAGIIPGKEECRGIFAVSLHYATDLVPGQTFTATLSNGKKHKESVVDVETLLVTSGVLALENSSSGSYSGDLAIASAPDGVIFTIQSNHRYLDGTYNLSLVIMQPDGSIKRVSPVSFRSDCEARPRKGVAIGSYVVSAVEADMEKTEPDIPVLVMNQYGAGKTLFIAYDLLDAADAEDSVAIQTDLLRNAVQHVSPSQQLILAGSVALLQTQIELSGLNGTVHISELLGDGLTHLPLFDLIGSPLDYSLPMDEESVEVVFSYFVRFSDEAKQFHKQTEAYFELPNGRAFLDSFTTQYTIDDDSGLLLDKALAWVDQKSAELPDASDLSSRCDHEDDEQSGDDHDLHGEEDDDDAHAGLSEIRDELIQISTMSLSSKRDIEKVISRVVKVMRYLDNSTLQTIEIRDIMSQYLRIVESGYYFVTE